ncbi:hypothetical protein GIB67_002786 [Kingdonia uniflora]|uniref:Uncharacterized protein n=1 Tax=Kingdonia uniflora TaxID=39325 RepID=A0A7J7LU74_9MAGN|nr:hypothetical protein GIB67_002786 [Kingdonia uniflora]
MVQAIPKSVAYGFTVFGYGFVQDMPYAYIYEFTQNFVAAEGDREFLIFDKILNSGALPFKIGKTYRSPSLTSAVLTSVVATVLMEMNDPEKELFNMTVGFYDKLESELQALPNTYYVGKLMAFELTERNSSYAMALVVKHFVNDKALPAYPHVKTVEAIKGGGGSIRVGTTGTVGSLMTRELDSLKCKTETLLSSKYKPKAILSNEVGSSGCSNSNNGNTNRSYQENTNKTRCKKGKNTNSQLQGRKVREERI